MSPQDVRARVEEIREVSADDEAGHIFEDQLYRDVLRAIADGTCEAPAECAGIALTAEKIAFARWCA